MILTVLDCPHRCVRVAGILGWRRLGWRGCLAAALSVVGELYGEVEIGCRDQRLDPLKIITTLAANAQFVTLDLGLDILRSLVADQLGDLLRVLLADAFLRGGRDLVELAG